VTFFFMRWRVPYADQLTVLSHTASALGQGGRRGTVAVSRPQEV